jgi:hypothetical protein
LVLILTGLGMFFIADGGTLVVLITVAGWALVEVAWSLSSRGSLILRDRTRSTLRPPPAVSKSAVSESLTRTGRSSHYV